VPRAVVIAGVRTPIGRYGGALAGVRPDDLAALAIREAVARAGVPPEEIEDVYFGAANQSGEDNRNVARMAALLAGLPDSVAGVTVNRLCAYGLAAVASAWHAVGAGDGDLFAWAASESMRTARRSSQPSRMPAYPRGAAHSTTRRSAGGSPISTRNGSRPSRWQTRKSGRALASRGGSDVRVESRSAGRAADAGRLTTRLSPSEMVRDEHPRPDTTLEKLATLKPAFRAGGTVTAGNASGINDGAAALVIASEEKARELGVEPLGAFLGSAVAGVDPRVMGIGPIPAVQKLLGRTGIEVGQLDLVELNEAFASQSLAVVRELGLDPAIVNVNGGAIAIGHPLGMSGARLVVSLLHELRRRGGRYGLATLCVGVGQGQAALFERSA
jgi:acetyl-CoA C-acetyltransferase